MALAMLSITGVLTLAVWLTQSMRFIDIVLNRGLSLSIFAQLVLLLVPDLLGLILPIGLMIAVLTTYNRLIQDNELIVMRSVGLSNLQLAKPGLVLALIVVGILYYLNLSVLPRSFQNFKDMEFRIRNNVGTYLLTPGEFNTFKDLTVYVRERRRNGDLRGLFIHDARDEQHTYTLTAEFGAVIEQPEGMRIAMLNGHRYEFSSNSSAPQLLTFDQYTIELTGLTAEPTKRTRKPCELYLNELMCADPENLGKKTARRYHAEAHSRLLMPWTALIYALICLISLLQGDYNRRGRVKALGLAAAACAFVQVTLLGLINYYERWTPIIWLAYGLVLASTLVPSVLLLRQHQRKYAPKARRAS